MAWYHESCFYHIYPLGLLGAERVNSYTDQKHRFSELSSWIHKAADLGMKAFYIGPLFESVGHGYETTDYRKIDSRIGTNAEFSELVKECHALGLKIVIDAVFNHTGRDFFAFQDLLRHREQSRFRDWYMDVNFHGNNSYGDGLSYATWGGYDLLPKLNLRNPEVRQYHLDTVRFWIETFDIDGLRLDAADVLDFSFLRELRAFTETCKQDFWLMGEVIHGDYSRWVNGNTLHAVTDYALYKALYSAHNDCNYFEIAHTIQRHMSLGLDPRDLYHFTDNHDVDRIMSKLHNPDHWLPVHILLFCLPGIPSIYYGSEYGIEGKKAPGDDSPVRPSLSLSAIQKDPSALSYSEYIRLLATLRSQRQEFAYGDYRQVYLTTKQFAFSRHDIIVAVNNDLSPVSFSVPCTQTVYHGILHNTVVSAKEDQLFIALNGCDGEIYIPEGEYRLVSVPKGAIEKKHVAAAQPEPSSAAVPIPNIPYEQMTVPQLQACILEKLAKNGPVTDRMRREVAENIYPNSLLNWVKSFR